jgi:hypothetical protein
MSCWSRAPAGWGKTALLADWLRTDLCTIGGAAVPIDESAAVLGDPTRALRGCPVVAVDNALHDLVPPDDPGPTPISRPLPTGCTPPRCTVVLDNTRT